MTSIVGTAALFAAAVYSASRAVHWFEAAPVKHDAAPYLRCIAWALLAGACILSLHPLWEACKP